MKNGKLRNITDPGPVPAPATYCKHCSQAFSVSVPIVGAPPETGFVQTTAQLAQHMQSKHPELVQNDVAAQVQASIAYSAQRVLDHFNSTDQGLLAWRDRERHRVFRAMLVRSVSDETITGKVSQLFEFASHREDGPQTPTMEEVILLIQSMRDAIEERDLYPEPAVQVPQLVV